MHIRLQTRAGTSARLVGASVLRIDFVGNPVDGATVTLRDERGFLHELHLTGAECTMLVRDLAKGAV